MGIRCGYLEGKFDKGERLKSGYKLKWLQQHGQAIVSNPK